jgi:hypothetical protein
MRPWLIAAALSVAVVPSVHAGGADKAVDVPKESARTAGHAVKDGALTFGHTVRDFFTKGPHAAKQTWQKDAAHTRADARAGKARVKAAAHE